MVASRPALAALVLLVSLAGCRGSVATQAPSDPPSINPTVVQSPATTPQPTPGATPEATLEPPPEATLVVASQRLIGRVGSYVWNGGSDTAPWLPAAALERSDIRADGEAVLEIDGGLSVEVWSARAAPASDLSGTGATGLAEGHGAPSFALPAPGEWVVQVQAQFAGGLGDAAWYWYLVVG